MGLPNVIVPSVIGRTFEEAREILSNKQLRPGQVSEQISDKEPGRIISQYPQPDNSVPIGSLVNLTIAKMPQDNIENPDVIELTEVPNVIRMPLQNAISEIKKAGLNAVDERFQKFNSKNNRSVINQNPHGGEKVKKGSFVVLKVAKSNPPVHINPMTTWLKLGGGIIFVLLLGGYLGWKSGKVKRDTKRAGKKEPELKLKIIPDNGEQSFRLSEREYHLPGLQIKIIPDKGIQTIKIN
jgi:hypothetical protein